MSDSSTPAPGAVPDPHAAPDGHSAAEIQKHLRGYLMVFGALLVLTIVTVLVSFHHFGPPSSNAGNIAVALVIATIKAGLVAAFFMHLSSEKWTIYRFLIVTVIFAFAMYALTRLAMDDPIVGHTLNRTPQTQN